MSNYKYRKGFAPSERDQSKNCSAIIYHGLKDKVDFGKHRMKTWETVILEDPEYIRWAFDNIPNFFLDEEATKVWRNRMLAKEADEKE
jgi:hypothetical protein